MVGKIHYIINNRYSISRSVTPLYATNLTFDECSGEGGGPNLLERAAGQRFRGLRSAPKFNSTFHKLKTSLANIFEF